MNNSFRFLIRTSFLAIFLVVCLGSFFADAAKKKAVKPASFSISANSALLFDEDGGKRHYSRDINQKVQPASTTKVMTALLVLEKKNLDDIVVISETASQALPSKIEVRPGEKYKVRDLLYALLLNSANDVAIALAESVAGSEKKFVQLMNRRAEQLGARHTKFTNASGLPTKAEQYSTAYDMFVIFRAALKKQFFREAIKVKFMNIRSREGRTIYLKSHNKLMFKGWKQSIYGKTGWTRAAQACFIGHVQKGSQSLVIAVFGCSTRWDDIKYIIEKYGGIDL